MKSKKQDLEFLFHPGSIALVGITSNHTSPLADIFLGPLLDFEFKGELYPVNPKGGEIRGLKVYPDIKEIPGQVDHVIASIPARLGPHLMHDCTAIGVKAVHFFTAGFSESDEEGGATLEAEITQIARTGGVRLIGPNCMGIYCPESRLSFRSEFPKDSGAVAYLCQSGGNSIHMVQMGAARGLRFSKVVSYGNAADINESDLLDYFIDDPDTKIIAIYIEGVKDGQRLVDTLAKAARVKPVVLLKGGVTEAGTRAVAGHTGALAGTDTTWDAICRQLRLIRVHSLEEMVDLLVTLSFMPPPEGRNVAIVGAGGGASVLATDDCESNHLVVPQFTQEVRDQLWEFMPKAGNSVKNPVDSQAIIWAPHQFVNTVRTVSNWEKINLLIGLLVSTDIFPSWSEQSDMYKAIARTMLESSKASSKPMAIVVQPGIRPEMTRNAFHIQQEFVSAGFPVYHSVAQAANAISKFIEYCHH